MSEPNWLDRCKDEIAEIRLKPKPGAAINVMVEKAQGLVSEHGAKKVSFAFNGQLITVERVEYL